MKSGSSTVGASSSPTVPIGSVYSGISVTGAASSFTPPVKSGSSTVGAASSPTVPIGSVYSGISVTVASLSLIPPGIPAPSRLTGKLWILSIAPFTNSVTS